MTPVQRLWARVEKGEGCWNWLGSTMTSGYGHVLDNGKPKSAHRLSWEIANGPIPERIKVLHHCDNRRCVRPDHLFLGTTKDNQQDMARKGRSTRGEKNTKARLKEADVIEIRGLVARGVSTKTLSARFGVTYASIGNVRRRQTWAYLP